MRDAKNEDSHVMLFVQDSGAGWGRLWHSGNRDEEKVDYFLWYETTLTLLAQCANSEILVFLLFDASLHISQELNKKQKS